MPVFFFLIAAVLGTPSAYASRQFMAPSFYWHDWYELIVGGVGGVTNGGTLRCIDTTLTNITTNRAQTVTVNFTTIPSAFTTSSSGNPGITVPMGIVPVGNAAGNVPISPSPQVLSQTVILAPGQSTVLSYCARYNFHNPTCYVGDWHYTGAFRIDFRINEDQGAVLAVLDSRMENGGCLIKMDSGMSALRNATRTIQVNGGRPF